VGLWRQSGSGIGFAPSPAVSPCQDHSTTAPRSFVHLKKTLHWGADKSLARPGRKQVTATEDFDFHIAYNNHNWMNISTIYIYNKTNIKRNVGKVT
jgi:hypothetical protein